MFEAGGYLGVRYIWRDDTQASPTCQHAPEFPRTDKLDFVRSELRLVQDACTPTNSAVNRPRTGSEWSPPSPGRLLVKISTHDVTGVPAQSATFCEQNPRNSLLQRILWRRRPWATFGKVDAEICSAGRNRWTRSMYEQFVARQ
jgi:hypothetical protein